MGDFYLSNGKNQEKNDLSHWLLCFCTRTDTGIILKISKIRYWEFSDFCVENWSEPTPGAPENSFLKIYVIWSIGWHLFGIAHVKVDTCLYGSENMCQELKLEEYQKSDKRIFRLVFKTNSQKWIWPLDLALKGKIVSSIFAIFLKTNFFDVKNIELLILLCRMLLLHIRTLVRSKKECRVHLWKNYEVVVCPTFFTIQYFSTKKYILFIGKNILWKTVRKK